MAVRCRSVGRGLARTNGRLADVKAYGPGAPMLAPSPRVMIPPATVAKSRTPGRVRSKRENHRAGKAGRSRLHLWYLPPAFFLAGVSRRLAFPAPSSREGETIGKTRAHPRRETTYSCACHSQRIEAATDDRTMDHHPSQGHGNHDPIFADTRNVASPSELERKSGAWASGWSRCVPAEVGLQTGNTVTAIRRALDASMVRRGETAIARNQLNAG